MIEMEEGTDIQACYVDNGVEKVSFKSYHFTTLPVTCSLLLDTTLVLQNVWGLKKQDPNGVPMPLVWHPQWLFNLLSCSSCRSLSYNTVVNG
jgi:hypothetical protein